MRAVRPPKVTGDGEQGSLVAYRKNAIRKRHPPIEEEVVEISASAQAALDVKAKKAAAKKKSGNNDSNTDKLAKAQLKWPASFIAIAWGWNSQGRCGNLTEAHIRFPKQIQR